MSKLVDGDPVMCELPDGNDITIGALKCSVDEGVPPDLHASGRTAIRMYTVLVGFL